MTEKVKVADLVAETLERLEIKHAFGIIGAGNVHLFEAIAKRGYTEIICVHHEQAAAMAMQTYYRTSGKLAAALMTTGGGSSNGVTGVLSAWADSIPGIVIAGNENSKHTLPYSPNRMWGVQGFDSVDMVKKMTKYANRVISPEKTVYELEKAAHITLDQRPGPVWIEIPMDIQSSFVEEKNCSHYVPPPNKDYVTEQLKTQVDSVVESLMKSKRPVLWLGHGIRLAEAHYKLPGFLNRLGYPALVSWAGIDIIDSDHPLVYGRAGVYGQRCANFVLQNSDYVLAIGTRLAIPQIGYNLTELAREAVIDVVDIDPVEATKLKPRINEAVVCDAGVFIDQLTEKLKDVELPLNLEWINTCSGYLKKFPWVDAEHEDKDGFINSYPFMKKLNEYFKPDQIVVTDMGTALLSGHQVLSLKTGQRLMTSTGLGEMGYGLPGAIGASVAVGNGEVMCLNCDGGMMMNLQELQTMVHHKLPIKLFIFNNDGYLMIKHTQNALFKNNRVGVDKSNGVSCPDFSKIAAAFDIPSYQIRTWEDCDKFLPEVQNATGPVICEVFMHPKQLFSPKLGMQMRDDGSLVSSPLEDLSPLIPRDVLKEAMVIGVNSRTQGQAKDAI
jgi:acetolactate synthase-1/2/3 large subunit